MEKLYADEDFPKPTVLFLRAMGYDVLTVFEAGKANQGIHDSDVLAYAITLERVVLTINRFDFMRLHRHSPIHFGIIVCTLDHNFEALAHRIDKILTENSGNCASKLLPVYKPDK